MDNMEEKTDIKCVNCGLKFQVAKDITPVTGPVYICSDACFEEFENGERAKRERSHNIRKWRIK
jgi:transcription elongation factor Elf1